MGCFGFPLLVLLECCPFNDHVLLGYNSLNLAKISEISAEHENIEIFYIL